MGVKATGSGGPGFHNKVCQDENSVITESIHHIMGCIQVGLTKDNGLKSGQVNICEYIVSKLRFLREECKIFDATIIKSDTVTYGGYFGPRQGGFRYTPPFLKPNVSSH